MALKDIVDVQITRQTAALTAVGFGTLAFVYDVDAGEEPADRVLTFGSADEVAASTDLTATAKAALTAAFSGDLRPDRVKAIYRSVDAGVPANTETLTEVLTAASQEDTDWYALAIEGRTDAALLEVAGWVESRDKLFIAATASAGVLDPNEDGDIASQILALSYSRTGIIYSDDAATTWPDMAWAGPLLPNDPGSITWADRKSVV